MKTLSYFAVTTQQVTTHAAALLKLEATINASATTGLYLQIHDSAAAPAAGAVPLKSWLASECGYKEFKRGELRCALGVFVALSSTAGTYTAAGGGSDKCDILNVELVDPEQPTGTSSAGDLTTGVTGRTIWTDATGPKRLIALEVDGTALTATSYIQLFAVDSPSNGDKPIDQFKIAAGGVLTDAAALRFGAVGRDVYSVDSNGAHDGCTVKISSTAGYLTLTSDTAKIKAEYK